MVAATPIAWPVAANEDDDVFARRASVVSSGVGLFAPPFRKTMHGGAGAHFLCLRQKTSKPALIRIISIRLQVGLQSIWTFGQSGFLRARLIVI